MFIAPSHRYCQRCASAAERCAGHAHPWSTAGDAMGASAKTRLARHHQAKCSTRGRILATAFLAHLPQYRTRMELGHSNRTLA